MTCPSVAFPGEFGAYSDEAVQTLFRGKGLSVPHRGIPEVCQSVEEGNTDYGLLPAENSAAGSVVACYDELAKRDLFIVGEIVRPIRHSLIGTVGSDIDGIRKVLSHPMAFAQCHRFLTEYKHLETVNCRDTANAARKVAEGGDDTVAAIAGYQTSDRYGLAVLLKNIQDYPDNETRFLLISKSAGFLLEEHKSGLSKTIAVFETTDQPGSLVNTLLPFSDRGINLSKIESRPGSRPWAYRFFIEMVTHDTAGVRHAVNDARRTTEWLRVLGTYATHLSSKEERTDTDHSFST